MKISLVGESLCKRGSVKCGRHHVTTGRPSQALQRTHNRIDCISLATFYRSMCHPITGHRIRSRTLLSNFSHCPNVEIFTFAVSSLLPSDSSYPHRTPIKMLLLSYPAIAILYLLLHLPSTNGAPNCTVCWPVGHAQHPVVGFDFTLGYGYALTVNDDTLPWVMTKALQNISCPIPERHLR
jgi:hypothetical protein